MDRKFDVATVLSVFSKIREHGTAVGDAYELEGVKASSDFDGYSIVLEDNAVKLYLNFHNTHQFDYEKIDQLNQFMDQLEKIEKDYD